MTLDATSRIGASNPLAAPATTTAATADDSVNFRRLLESLEQLAKEHRTAAPVSDADAVQAAMNRADAGFTLAMDLTRQLEEAFRNRQP